jgi:ABC-2 type transport system ATP-binding protein
MLDVAGLSRAYGAVKALDGMTFAVRPGFLTGFLGPNGAGKTTTMRAIFGLTALDAGEVRWNGRAVTADDRRTFGYLPEERGLYPNMRIGDQLVYLGRLHGLGAAEAKRRSTEWLERLGLADRVSSNLEDLSLGNQQRVQLIGALLHEPHVLVLDEPFSGLDPVAVDALSSVLRDEAHRGATVLFSSHQLDLVEHLCEDAIIVDHGRVVTQGSLDELTAGHQPILAVEVHGDRDGAWAAALDPAKFGLLGVADGTVRIELHDTDDAVPDASASERAQPVLDAARASGPVSRFAFERRSLAETFLALVGRRADEVDA